LKRPTGTNPAAERVDEPVMKHLPTGLSIVPQRRLGQEIARYIRDGITSGAFAAGERLAPLTIAEGLGVSAMPVREALLSLASEGLIEVLPRRGFRVGTIQPRDIEDAFRVHAFVAGLLAADAAPVIDAETIARLYAVQQSIERIGGGQASKEQTSRIEKLNFEFHRTINTVTNAGRLRWFLRAASRYVPRHFYESISGWVETTVIDHPAIIESLQRHDAEASRALMERHVLRAGSLVLRNLAQKSATPK
jgi:DNA-binding GntR family transcriptional regulator